MNKYHNQELIKSNAQKIKALNTLDRQSVEQNLLSAYYKSKEEYESISSYTAPEEVTRRQQSFYYFVDILDELGIEPTLGDK